MSRYRRSEALLESALRRIPLGSQTFSKSVTQYPHGASPYFITHGLGSRVWDVDGNEYIDFNNSLAAVTLGYNDPDVSSAVIDQVEKGSIFSLPHPIENDVAELIIDMVPCAEMVRFGKNGSDVTTGAVRLARAFTGRDHIILGGYHGWHDWSIGTTTRNAGVPAAVQDLSHTFTYNDLGSLKKLFDQYPGQVAAVIMEPMGIVEPDPGFLEGIRELTREQGSLLVFDEIITGFRFSRGGAQELFNVTPDLATFGKGVANGYPLSVLTGREHIMRMLEEVFFSFTFGGETLSLAAAYATLLKLLSEPVVETISARGNVLKEGIQELIGSHEMDDVVSIVGHPAGSFLIFRDLEKFTQHELKSFFLQEVFARGILTIGSHNISYAISDDDIQEILAIYGEVFPILKRSVDQGDLRERLNCETLQPLFRIR